MNNHTAHSSTSTAGSASSKTTGKNRRGAPQKATRDTKYESLAKTLPEGDSALLDVAKQAVEAFDVAIMAGDDTAAAVAFDLYEAVVFVLNGWTFFACRGDDEAAGYVVARHCAAVSGAVPGWGQSGEFVIEADGMRALVVTGWKFGGWLQHFSFHAIDFDRPFISETGYRSHFQSQPYAGVTVDEAARLMLRSFVREDGRKMIDRDAHCREDLSRFAWLEVSPAPELQPSVSRDGQFGFAF